MKIIKLEGICYTKDSEPGIKMDFLSKNQLSIPFRPWWIVTKWKQTTFTLTIKKEAGKLL